MTLGPRSQISGQTQGSATDRVTRPGNFKPGEKFYFEPGTRPGLEIQPANPDGPGIPGSDRVF